MSSIILWFVSQEHQIAELRGEIDRSRLEHDLAGGPRKMTELAQENLELKVRLALLVRLLITKGVISAQEYATLIAEAQPGRIAPAHGIKAKTDGDAS